MRGLVATLSVLLSLAGLIAEPALAERRLALVIGNDNYEKLPTLQKAVNDAGAVEAALSRLGFKVSRVANASRRVMNERIESFAGQVERGDTALFFFAGHGVEIKGTNYLLPTDTPDARDGQEGLVSREGIAADSIIERLQERGARVTLMVLDACRDNPFKRPGTRGVGGTRGLAPVTPAEGVFVLFSAGQGQTALDRLSNNDPHPNSVFTRTFVNLIGRPGLSMLDIAKTTQTEVRRLALTVDHKQQPAFYDQIDGVYVLAAPGAAAAVAPPAAPPSPPPPRPVLPPVAALPPAVSAPAAPPPAVASVFTSRSAAVGSGPANVTSGAYPARPITIVVPFGPGASTDLVARLISQQMTTALRQPVIVENAPGAGGAIGLGKARNAAPDGYTLVLGGSASMLSGLGQQQKSYDMVADFAGVGLVAAAPMVIAARKDLPASDLRGFIAHLKTHADKVQYASAGSGSATHLACHLFNSLANTPSTHIPYRGTAPAITDLVGGRVDYICGEALFLAQQAKSGAIKPLVAASSDRIGALPDLPTAAEAGLPGFLMSSWFGLFVPKGTTRSIVDRLSHALGRALDDPTLRQRLLETIGELPAAAHRSPQALDAFVRAETARWTPVVKAAGIN